MKKWEYKTFNFSTSETFSIADKANNEAKDGWRLVSVVAFTQDRFQHIIAYFEREIPEPPENQVRRELEESLVEVLAPGLLPLL